MSALEIRSYMSRFGAVFILIWTIIVILLAAISINSHHDSIIKEAQNEARDYFSLNLFYRAWSSKMGGVYVQIDKVEPNKYLQVPDRDITTSDNRQLTLVNPAYMTRMVFESILASSSDPVISKITSLNPLNPINAPDEWEKQSLEGFERQDYKERSEITNISGKPYLRLISMFVTEESCLKCHARQGYRKGDVRGAIVISVPLTQKFITQSETDKKIFGGYFILWMLGSSGIAISSRRRSIDEEKIRISEQKFRTVCDWTQDWEYWLGPDGTMKYVSPSCFEITGHTPEEFINDPELILKIVHQDQSKAFAEHHALSIDVAKWPCETIEFQVTNHNDELRWVQHLCRPIFDGEVFLGRRASNRDITERKLAEIEKSKLEEQLQQAQKLESIGRLAGGVAHDFNNMLSVILGHAELAITETDPKHSIANDLEEIRKAAERSADLTRQLLAFARKQTILPQVLDLNLTIPGMLKMLQRLIGEDINLVFKQASDLWLVNVDPSQIDQILANLCVNARDAINGVGKITIETGNRLVDLNYTTHHLDVIPGDYVTLTISDSGCGIDKETLTHVFEPFFTTKEIGKGSGLGLSTVFGAVKQNSGFINIYSEPGLGTTISINLPRYTGTSEKAQQEELTVTVKRGKETILLVEDELAILKMAAIILTKQGYTVLQANSQNEAMNHGRQNADKIDLLITDVIMPDVNGKDLAAGLKTYIPELKCLFMSGYTADAIARHGVLEDGVHFIQKPFTLAAITDKVREVLDSN